MNFKLNNRVGILKKLARAVKINRDFGKNAWTPDIFLFLLANLDNKMLLLKYFLAMEIKSGK
ncbi:MAG: hypothetical protein L0958_04760 [Candidatus Mariimomonas ferrooxydans]